jgi:hypothetical protein
VKQLSMEETSFTIFPINLLLAELITHCSSRRRLVHHGRM